MGTYQLRFIFGKRFIWCFIKMYLKFLFKKYTREYKHLRPEVQATNEL